MRIRPRWTPPPAGSPPRIEPAAASVPYAPHPDQTGHALNILSALTPTSVRWVFERALVARVVTFNPCAHTELPKRVKKKARTLTPEEYAALLAALPEQHRLMMETAINTGLRWGELIALKPRQLDLATGKLTVEETIVEVSYKNSPTGQRMLTKPYPKDNEPAPWPSPKTSSTGSPPGSVSGASGPVICCSQPATAPPSAGIRSAPVWVPAVTASGVDFDVRVHDLRHAHASWLLAGGSDIRSVMDRIGHAQITTTKKYLHTLPDADRKNLSALDRIRNAAPASPPEREGQGKSIDHHRSSAPASTKGHQSGWWRGFCPPALVLLHDHREPLQGRWESWREHRDEVAPRSRPARGDAVLFALRILKDGQSAWDLAHSLALDSDHSWGELIKAHDKADRPAVLHPPAPR